MSYVYRSAENGQFATEEEALKHPERYVKELVYPHKTEGNDTLLGPDTQINDEGTTIVHDGQLFFLHTPPQRVDDATAARIIFEALGTASVAWVGGPGNREFDSELAAKAGRDALEALGFQIPFGYQAREVIPEELKGEPREQDTVLRQGQSLT